MTIRGITKETEKMKSTNDVLDHHLKAIEQGDVDAVLSDYAPDAVLFREDGCLEARLQSGRYSRNLSPSFRNPVQQSARSGV
jgi:hypothetical protein